MGSEGEAFSRTPIVPKPIVVPTTKAATTSALSTLDGMIVESCARDWPSIVMINSFQRVFTGNLQLPRIHPDPCSRRRDQVATPNVDLVYRSSTAVGRSERALLDSADDVDVLALFVRRRHVGNFVVEDEAVPICARLGRAVFAGRAIRFAEARIRNLGPRG